MKSENNKNIETKTTIEKFEWPENTFRFKEVQTEYKKTDEYNLMQLSSIKAEYSDPTQREMAIYLFVKEEIEKLKEKMEKDLDRKKDK